MVAPTASGTKAELILHALFWPGLPEGNGCHPRVSPSCGTLHFRSPDKAGAIVPAFVEGPRKGSEGDIIVYSERKNGVAVVARAYLCYLCTMVWPITFVGGEGEQGCRLKTQQILFTVLSNRNNYWS